MLAFERNLTHPEKSARSSATNIQEGRLVVTAFL